MGRKINKIKLFINDNEKSTIVAKDLEMELLKYGFEIDNNKIILKDIEKEVEFLENGLENLATKYEIFQ